MIFQYRCKKISSVQAGKLFQRQCSSSPLEVKPFGAGKFSETFEMAYQLLEDNLEIFYPCKTSRLCHGDLWVTNLLVEETGQVTGVIDFDRTCWGDIEWDLAIAEYCGVTRPPFWEGYGERIDTHTGNANIRRMFYLLYEHQKYIIIALSNRRNDPSGAERYARESVDIMRQFGRSGDILV